MLRKGRGKNAILKLHYNTACKIHFDLAAARDLVIVPAL